MANEKQAAGTTVDDAVGATRDDIRNALGLPAETGDKADDAAAAATADDKITDAEDVVGDAEKADKAAVNQQAAAETDDAVELDFGDDIPADVLGTKDDDSDTSGDDDEIPEPEDMNEKQAAAFKAMRERNQALKDQLSKTSATTVDPTEHEQLKAQLAEMQKRVAAADIREDPAFKARFDGPMRLAFEEAKTMMREFGGNDQVAAQALRLPLRQRKALLTEKVPDAAAELSLLFTRIDSLNRQRQQALSDHERTRSQLAAEKQRQQESRIGQAFDTALADLRKNGVHLLMESPKNADWNKGVQARLDAAKAFLGDGNDPTKAAQIALKAAIADGYIAMYVRKNKQLQELQQRLEKRGKASGKIGAASTAASSKTSDRKARSGEEVANIVAARAGRSRSQV